MKNSILLLSACLFWGMANAGEISISDENEGVNFTTIPTSIKTTVNLKQQAPRHIDTNVSIEDDLESYDVMTYDLLYSPNSEDENYDEWFDYSCLVSIKELRDNEYLMENLYGRSFINPNFSVVDNKIEMPLGQIFSTKSYNYKLVTIEVVDEETVNMVEKGNLEFNLTSDNCIAPSNYDFVGLYVYSLSWEPLGWNIIAPATLLYKSNAVISYFDNAAQSTITHRLYCTYTKGGYTDSDYGTVDKITMSGITPDGLGAILRFGIYEDEVWPIGDAVAYIPQPKNEVKYYACTRLQDKSNNTYIWAKDIVGKINTDYTRMLFPTEMSNPQYVTTNQWSIMKENGTMYGNIYKNTFVDFDYPINQFGEAGIKDVMVSEDINPSQTEYYNMQGIRLGHPTPGQMCIMRQGSKVSKIIYR